MSTEFQKWFKNRRIALSLPLLLLGCAAPAAYQAETGQVTIRQASSSLQQEGAEAFSSYKQKHQVSRDSAARSRVMRVASRLKPHVNLPGAAWEFEVFEDPSANAFALPGGKVGVNTGLLKVAQTDGQLATVIAHEMAHVTSNHAESRLRNKEAVALGGAILGAVLGQGQDLGALAQKGTEVAFGLSFSRAQELEADRIGTIFMAKAGYDPEEAITLWQRMGERSQSGGLEFLSTHPVSSTRIQKLREFMPHAKAQQR